MKNFTRILVLLLVTSASVHSQSFKSAVEYLDFISNEQQDISKNMWRYTKALAHSKSDRTILKRRESMIKTLEKAIANIQKADGYDGDDYKNQVLEYMRLNESLLKHDYAKIVDMKEVAEQSYDLMEAYMLAQEMADQKMEEAQKLDETNFYQYAAKHNINIIENDSDLSKKMKLSNDVFKHYNEMYLLFFKAHINQIYLWDAMKANDISSIQQNTNALNQAAKSGLEALDTISPYSNDKSLIEATRKVFENYIKETETSMPQVIEFHILNEDFEAIKNTIEKTPEKKRTKDQIEAYNTKVNEINKAIKNYNKVNTEMNQNSEKALNQLNEANEKFLAKHIPND